MKAVFLDAGSLDRGDLDWGPLEAVTSSLTRYDQTAPEEIVERLRKADAAIVNKVPLDEHSLRQLPALRWIGVAATGMNNIDLVATERYGIAVSNCRDYGSNSVIQHLLALLLSIFTRLPNTVEEVRAGGWSNSPHFCLIDPRVREVAGKRLGIVGYGTLGRRLEEVASALGMEVWISERPGVKTPREGRKPFETVLSGVDILSLHCPLTAETHRMIDRRALALMRKDAVLINTARGGLIDELALVDALRRGEIAAAALDVLSAEPPGKDHPLLDPTVPNLTVTAHCAWTAREARQRIIGQLAEGIAAGCRG